MDGTGGLVVLRCFPGWWYTYPSGKYDESSVGMMTFPIQLGIWKVIQNSMVPNHHQAVTVKKTNHIPLFLPNH